MDLKSVFKECPVCAKLNKNYVLKAPATSKQKSNFVRSLNRLRIISEQIDRNIFMHFFFVKSGHAYFIFAMESMLLKKDGGQWLVIRQGFILNDCIKL